MHCHVCGMTFRSMRAEAKHRHNFPALCNTSSRQWKRWHEERDAERRDYMGQIMAECDCPQPDQCQAQGFCTAAQREG
jgi:hypothetical protein